MRFLRYLLIGLIAYAIDFGCFLALLSLQIIWVGPIAASISGKLISSIFSLFAHRWFTFKNESHLKVSNQAWRYFLLVLFNTQLSAFILYVNLQVVPNPILAKLTTDGICVLISYWLSKCLVFVRH